MRRKFLIYALVSACIIALTWADGQHDVNETLCDAEYAEFAFDEQIGCGSYICECETAINPPRPTSYTAAGRTIANAKRHNSQSGMGSPVIKSGKLLNQKTIISSLNSLRHYPSGLSETIHHLISLGKLVI